MSDEITATAKAELEKLGAHGRAALADAKAGNPSSLVLLVISAIAVVFGLVHGLVHTHV